MATLNASHHESGGVVLFAGELILLYCDNVNITVENKSQSDDSDSPVSHLSNDQANQSRQSKGRLYLTTHRIIFTSDPIHQNANLKSFSAPFYAMFDLSLQQPVFGANFIKGRVRPEAQPDSAQGITFKLKFSHGGCIEFGQAMDNAAKQASVMARNMHFQPPPPYTTNAGQFYDAPANVYQPAYACGFALPTQVFGQAPPAGFIYTMEAPPPYPGLNTAPREYPQYPQQMGYPAHGYVPPQANGPAIVLPVIVQNGGQASAPPMQPPGYAYETPPSYDEATKKVQ